MITITLENAQRDLPALVKPVLAGEEIVIGVPGAAVKLAPLTIAQGTPEPDAQRKSYRGRGALKGQIVVGPEFFEPLGDEECGVAPDSGAA